MLAHNLLEKWCPGADSNHRHADFQSAALPTELPGHAKGLDQPFLDRCCHALTKMACHAETTSWDIAAWLAAVQPEFGQNQTTVIPLAGSDPNRRQSRLNLQRNAIFDETWPGRLPARQSCCRQSCHRQHRPPEPHICLESNTRDQYRHIVSSKTAVLSDQQPPRKLGSVAGQLWPF